MAVTPIRRSLRPVPAPMPQPMAAPSQQDWVWDGVNWCPPGCPPPCPPQPCPPTPPSCFSFIAKADACWDQSQALFDLVTKVVEDIFEKNPGIIPPPPPGAGTGPIIGVTDGSNANPGEVGEFVGQFFSIPFAAYPNVTNTNVSLVLQPGDWDCTCSAEFNTPIGGTVFRLTPLPVGMFNDMTGGLMIGTSTISPTPEWPAIVGMPSRGSFSIPTLLPFNVQIFQNLNSALLAGNMQLWFGARRRR